MADITERQRIEQALQASEERFRVLADAMPQLAWIADADGGIYWFNRRLHDYTGASAEAMAGWGWQSVIEANALPTLLDRWQAAIASGEPFEMSFPIRGADGMFRDFLAQALPIKDDQGRIQQWVGTNTDITSIKEAEAALRENAARVHLATAATGVGIWEWDVATDRLQWDAEMFRIYGIPPVPGRQLAHLVRLKDARRVGNRAFAGAAPCRAARRVGGGTQHRSGAGQRVYRPPADGFVGGTC